MDLLDLIKKRRTVRKHKSKRVPKEIIEKIIEAGRWAPSAHNLQPWKFVIVDNDDKINQIADLLDKRADELYSGFNIVMRDTAKNLRRSHLLLAIYSNKIITDKFNKLGSPYSEIGNIYEIQSVTNAIENILLYSHSLNLGMAWYGMTLFCEKEINVLLNQTGRLMAVLSLGYPDEVPAPSVRKEISEIVEFIK
ncbi:MAG: hypothetical protein A2Z72_01950 [Omnitrophica bacterium RBG_13_46_9]|nr:MAG: hypothetical protein A2Z72_01950 [Omnitrophica bacterium RBG_13_46_9]